MFLLISNRLRYTELIRWWSLWGTWDTLFCISCWKKESCVNHIAFLLGSPNCTLCESMFVPRVEVILGKHAVEKKLVEILTCIAPDLEWARGDDYKHYLYVSVCSCVQLCASACICVHLCGCLCVSVVFLLDVFSDFSFIYLKPGVPFATQFQSGWTSFAKVTGVFFFEHKYKVWAPWMITKFIPSTLMK